MRICHVLTSNPDTSTGGTVEVVKNIRKHIKSDFIHGRWFLPTAIKLLFRNYDIIHIHDMEGYAYTLLPKSLRKKIVYTPHGLWSIYFAAHPPAGLLQRLRARIALRMQKTILSKADQIVAVSNAVKKEIGHLGINQEKVVVVYNGVDTKHFHAGKQNNKVAIWVGDNPELKGLGKAMAYAAQHSLKLIVVGIDGVDTENIKFLGRVPPEKMPGVYGMAGTLLFFSKGEGHPLVPLEAMACGLSVVASKESNIEIIPLRNGIYNIGGSMARKIVEKYDWEIQSKKYEEIYKRLGS